MSHGQSNVHHGCKAIPVVCWMQNYLLPKQLNKNYWAEDLEESQGHQITLLIRSMYSVDLSTHFTEVAEKLNKGMPIQTRTERERGST